MVKILEKLMNEDVILFLEMLFNNIIRYKYQISDNFFSQQNYIL